MKFLSLVILFATAAIMTGCMSEQPEAVVNVYSQRHYEIDKALFEAFEKETGIRVNVVNAGADELIVRLESEGELTQADIIITGDAGRIDVAKRKDLLQPVQAEKLGNNVDPLFCDQEGYWYGLSYRARLIAASNRLNDVSRMDYAELSSPEWQSALTMRSSSSAYNQGLLASVIAHVGKDSALQWTRGVVNNLHHAPNGNDRDQIRNIAAGEGDLTLINSYYIAKMIRSTDERERNAVAKTHLVFPKNGLAHVNASAIGMVKHAKNPGNALKLMQFLTSPESQKRLAWENYEFPVNPDVELPEVLAFRDSFNIDTLHLGLLGNFHTTSSEVFQEAGWN